MIDIQVVIVIIEYIIYSLFRLRRAFRNQNTCFILIFSQVYDHMAVLETPTYCRAWNLYSQFSSVVFHTALVQLPISPSNLGLFIAYMFQRNYASSTANTYVFALGYYHRLAGVPDPTKVFWVLEMLKGYGKLGSRWTHVCP